MAHETVLLEEAVEALAIEPNDIVVDGTIGGAGHFSAILEKLGPKGTLIGIDADREAIERAEEVIKTRHLQAKTILVEENFRNLSSILDEQRVPEINKSLFDLGWSGFQLTRGRGFSFQTDEPLQMTYGDPATQKTAEDVVNGASEEELGSMLWELGEEQFSRKIATAIIEARKQKRITTTFELVQVIKNATPAWYQHKKINPATKTFQALRIYVNDEFGALIEGLNAAMARTKTEGRIAVITFHSTEDRIVKNMFRKAVEEGIGALVFKKPHVPSDSELKKNSRARSAKLRVIKII